MQRMRAAVLGGGNMGSAVARALMACGDSASPGPVVVAEPDPAKHAALREGIGVEVVSSAPEAMALLDPDGMVVVAVKPQLFSGLAAEVGDVGERLIVSVMAGCAAERVRRELGGRGRVVRVMPNLPVTVGYGMTGVSAGPGSTEHDVERVCEVFARLGRCEEIAESMMDAITAVASSGPAYVFYLAEAMINAAIDLGLAPDQARTIVAQTILGAARMMNADGAPPDELRRRVTSKGGTTQAATTILDEARVMEAVARAIRAARDRGRELAG